MHHFRVNEQFFEAFGLIYYGYNFVPASNLIWIYEENEVSAS